MTSSLRAVIAALLAIGVAVAAAGCVPGPPQPTPPALGSNSPCGRTDVQLTNPSNTANPIYVAYPTGTASARLTGGTCGDSNRPVVFLVHGWLANSNVLYEGVIDHFARTGNIVVMATYGSGNLADVQGSADIEVQAIAAAVPQLEREDMTDVGLVGHSLGGGMLPYVTQQVVQRGWGGDGLWMFSLAPYQGIGSGTITFPAHARAVIEAYDQDILVSRSVGVDLFRRLSIPNSQKDHVTVRSSSHGGASLTAQHTSPNSIISPDDAIKFYAIYRVGDILEGCALTGQNCSADSSLMGSWSDGTAVPPLVVTDNP
jgi:triacylglycerol esterase/lipase EstA (alpha/beta hydrolase family)